MHRNPRFIRSSLVVALLCVTLSWTFRTALAEPPGSAKPMTMTAAERSAAGSNTSKGEAAAMQAQYMEESSKPTTGMADYIIISPHTVAECNTALEQTEQLGTLSKFEWGCKQGDHTGYAIVRAASKEEALGMVPESVRGKARIIKLDRFTAADLEAMHAPKAH